MTPTDGTVLAGQVEFEENGLGRTLLRAALAGLVALVVTAAATFALTRAGFIGGTIVAFEDTSEPTPTVAPATEPVVTEPATVEPTETGLVIPELTESDFTTPAPGTEPVASEAINVRVQVLDGVGDPARVADAADVLADLGYEIVATDTAAVAYPETTVIYTEGFRDEAERLVASDPRFTKTAPNEDLKAPADLHVVVGEDWPSSG